jgi:hypothetical protein
MSLRIKGEEVIEAKLSGLGELLIGSYIPME